MQRVEQPSAEQARALALAAVRETFEEAGLLIGVPLRTAMTSKAEGWRAFFAHGFQPALAGLKFIARAITPPGRPRRFDSRFFCVQADAIVHRVKIADGELSDLEWHSIAQARSLELPKARAPRAFPVSSLIAPAASCLASPSKSPAPC